MGVVQMNSNPLAKDFNTGSLLKFAFPTISMMLFMGLYTIVDTIFVSRFVNTNALSAINIVCPVINLIVGLGTMIATGGSAIVARKMGAGEPKRAKQDFTLLILFGFILGVVIFILGIIFIDEIIYALGADKILFPYCKDYLTIILLFTPASMLQVLFQNLFVTAGKPTLSLLITFMVIGFGISFFVVPQVLIIIATIVLGMSVTTIFNIDKKSGWLKTSITFPTKKSSIISCKYLMYSFVSIIGVFFGIGFSTAISLIIKDTNFNFLPTFIYLSVIMTFFSGSILLPCFYLLDEEKSMIGAMVSYPLGAGFVFVMTKLIGNNILSMTISTVLSLILFIVSWYFLSKYVEKNDIQ